MPCHFVVTWHLGENHSERKLLCRPALVHNFNCSFSTLSSKRSGFEWKVRNVQRIKSLSRVFKIKCKQSYRNISRQLENGKTKTDLSFLERCAEIQKNKQTNIHTKKSTQKNMQLKQQTNNNNKQTNNNKHTRWKQTTQTNKIMATKQDYHYFLLYKTITKLMHNFFSRNICICPPLKVSCASIV